MKLLIGLLLLVAAVLIAKAIAKNKGTGSREGTWPYREKQVLTEPEQVLYFRLKEACPELIVLAQVGLSRVIESTKRQEMKWFGKIAQKSVDFVICKKDASVVVAIELDDASHKRNRRQQADADKEKALNDAGVTLVRWEVSALPTAEQIRATVAKMMIKQPPVIAKSQGHRIEPSEAALP